MMIRLQFLADFQGAVSYYKGSFFAQKGKISILSKFRMYSRWRFQICFFNVHPVFWEIIPFDQYVSDGLVQPATSIVLLENISFEFAESYST